MTDSTLITILIILSIFPIVAAIITPPDVVSQLILAAEMAIIFGVVIFVISRLKWFTESPETRKRTVTIAVCLFSIFVGFCRIFIAKRLSSRPEQSEQIEGREYQE